PVRPLTFSPPQTAGARARNPFGVPAEANRRRPSRSPPLSRGRFCLERVMPKPQKQAKVKELTERFRSSASAMLADYRGLSVKDATEVRRSLREAGNRFSVVKNTLTRLAVREAGLEGVL